MPFLNKFTLVCLLALSFWTPSSPAASQLRGITISCQTYGPEWASPEMAAALDEIKSLGATAFSIHPFAQIRENGAVDFPKDFAPEMIVRPARWAREKGLTMMLVPHLAYWGTSFSWRGEIDFKKADEWDRFFANYTEWMVGLAGTCERERIPILCIGLEYTHAAAQTERWREMIRQIRAVYHGELTYGANWDTYQDVQFWDALDDVGVLAYFPLATSAQVDPSDEILRSGWNKWLKQLGDFSKKMGKPILFTELGYNESSEAASHPWDYKIGGPGAAALQRRCLKVALEEIAASVFVRGVFLWKWFPNMTQRHAENFDLRQQEPRAAIWEAWGH